MATNLSDTYCICGEEHGELTECVEGEKCRGGGWFHKVCALGSGEAAACEEESTYVCPLCVVRRALLPSALRYHDTPWVQQPTEREQSDDEGDGQESSLVAGDQEGEGAGCGDSDGGSSMEESHDGLASTSEEEEEEEEEEEGKWVGWLVVGTYKHARQRTNRKSISYLTRPCSAPPSHCLPSNPSAPLASLIRSDRGARRQRDPALRRERRPPQIAHAQAKAAAATKSS